MLPQTRGDGSVKDEAPHEAIGEIHGHTGAMRQLFLPTSESRRFTRHDAARAFDERLLPADERTPHRELVTFERDKLAILQPTLAEEGDQIDSKSGSGRPQTQAQLFETFRQASKDAERAVVIASQRDKEYAERAMTKVKTERFEFRFKNVSVHSAGQDGKSANGVGWRYGVPLFDRKRGQIKIPTQVPDVARLN